MAGSNVTFVSSDLSQNKAGYFGGAIVLTYGILTVSSSKIVGNSAPLGGGALKSLASVVQIDGCTITGNTAASGGFLEVSKPTGFSPIPTISVIMVSVVTVHICTSARIITLVVKLNVKYMNGYHC